MRIDPDTKDALLFITGLLGIIAQAVLGFLGAPVSLPLIGAFLTMCGIAAAPSVWGGGKNEEQGKRNSRGKRNDRPGRSDE